MLSPFTIWAIGSDWPVKILAVIGALSLGGLLGGWLFQLAGERRGRHRIRRHARTTEVCEPRLVELVFAQLRARCTEELPHWTRSAPIYSTPTIYEGLMS